VDEVVLEPSASSVTIFGLLIATVRPPSQVAFAVQQDNFGPIIGEIYSNVACRDIREDRFMKAFNWFNAMTNNGPPARPAKRGSHSRHRPPTGVYCGTRPIEAMDVSRFSGVEGVLVLALHVAAAGGTDLSGHY
jgi:hypothetical protein